MWYQACEKCQSLIEVGKWEEAYDSIKDHLEENKEIVQYYAAILSYHLGKIDESIYHYHKFLDIRPNYPHVHYGLFGCYAMKDDLPTSYKYFESRFKINSTFALYRQRFDERHWDGKQKGKTIYVYHEQGIGDMIQLIRFLPRLREFFDKIIVEAPQELNGVITEADFILPRGTEPLSVFNVDFDYGLSLGSLPGLLGITKDTTTPKIPYIFPRVIDTPNLKVRNFILSKPGKRIGVCWLGSTSHLNDKDRSMKMEDFMLLLDKGNIYNLTLQNSPFINIDLRNFQETANVIAQLDLVVTVDTAVAHLAGAMNKPTWLLLGKLPDSRWGFGETTYWYPSIRIFRSLEKIIELL